MKNGSHLEVVASIKDMNTDLNREFEVGSEEYNQASRGFWSSKTSNLLRVSNHHETNLKRGTVFFCNKSKKKLIPIYIYIAVLSSLNVLPTVLWYSNN